MVNSLTERCGGTAGNIAYNLALLEEKPFVLATAGKDFGTYRERFEKLGLPFDGIVELPEEFTAGCYITTDKSNCQITGFNPGAMKFASQFKFERIEKEKALAIISPGNLEDMIGYSKYYKSAGISHIVDPGQQIPWLSGEQLDQMITASKLLISNDYELEMIKNATGLTIKDLLEKTEAIITTFAEKGSRILTREGEEQIPVVTAKDVVDPTGAGDAYRAGLIKGMVKKKDIATSAKMGAACASFCVEYNGTQEHRFTIDAFWDRYNKVFQ